MCPTRQKYLETEDKIKTSTQELWIDKNLNNFIKQAIIFPRSKIQEQYNLILGKCLLRDQSVLAIGAHIYLYPFLIHKSSFT